MDIFTPDTIQITGHGRQNCSDMHSWGPGTRQSYCLHYVINGSGYLECNKKRYHIKTGESFLLFPYLIVHYYPDSEDPWEYTWIDFQGGQVPAILENSSLTRQNPTSGFVDPAIVLPFFDRVRGLDIFNRNKQEANGIMLSILGHYADTFPAPDIAPTKTQERLKTAILLIQSNYHEPSFNVEVLCDMTHCSRITIYRLFHEELGMSPSQYLTTYRIHQACKMLNRGLLVKTTALSCGFSDQFYFTRVFRQLLKISPSEYIKIPAKEKPQPPLLPE